mgnify:CR=1 FL=1
MIDWTNNYRMLSQRSFFQLEIIAFVFCVQRISGFRDNESEKLELELHFNFFNTRQITVSSPFLEISLSFQNCGARR